MSQLSIKLSDKADALIAQLQKEIFNRRRKKVTAAGVVETLVESGARSQSDKRFSTSWTNLIKDIEKAAKLANAHGSKPSTLSDAEWAMVLSHRQKAATSAPAKSTARKRTAKAAASVKAAATVKTAAKAKTGASAKTSAAAKTTAKPKAAKPKAAAKPAKTVRKAAATSATTTSTAARKPRPAKRARKTTTGSGTTSVAKRMAKAAGRLSSGSSLSASGISSPARS